MGTNHLTVQEEDDMNRSASLPFLSQEDLYDHEKPYEVWMPTDDPIPRTNCVFVEQHETPKEDVRDRSDEFTLGTGGFEFIQHDTSQLAITGSGIEACGREAILPYLNETIELVKQHTQAEKAICFDWRVWFPK
jgi:hypothetical protein